MNMNNLARTHEILTPQLATKVGLTKFEFYKYVKANEYEQVGHGVYAAKDTWIDELAAARWEYFLMMKRFTIMD